MTLLTIMDLFTFNYVELISWFGPSIYSHSCAVVIHLPLYAWHKKHSSVGLRQFLVSLQCCNHFLFSLRNGPLLFNSFVKSQLLTLHASRFDF